MNVPFVAVHLAVYESAKKVMSGHREESLAVQLVAGGTAGGTAAALTNPLDMVKTRLQLEGVNSATKYGTTHVVSTDPSSLDQQNALLAANNPEPLLTLDACVQRFAPFCRRGWPGLSHQMYGCKGAPL